MATFDLNNIKLTFMDSIRTYVYPQQLHYEYPISLFARGNTINQECYLFYMFAYISI